MWTSMWSEHFSPEDFINPEAKKRRLKHDAVPSILENLSNGRFRGDGDFGRKWSYESCNTAHDHASLADLAETSTTWKF